MRKLSLPLLLSLLPVFAAGCYRASKPIEFFTGKPPSARDYRSLGMVRVKRCVPHGKVATEVVRSDLGKEARERFQADAVAGVTCEKESQAAELCGYSVDCEGEAIRWIEKDEIPKASATVPPPGL